MNTAGYFELVPAARRETIAAELRPAITQALESLGDSELFFVHVPERDGDAKTERSVATTSIDAKTSRTLVIVAWDYPGLFSTLTGLLSASRFEIERGSIITTEAIGGRRAVVDIFYGNFDGSSDEHSWLSEFREVLGRAIGLLENARDAGIDSPARLEARQIVIEAVSKRLSEKTANSEGLLMPMEVGFEQTDASGVPVKTGETAVRTRLRLSSKDTPFFLYSVSVSLSLHNVSIEHVEISTEGDQVSDVFELVDSRGKAILDENRLNRIRLSVLLSKQFTHFLDRAPDPARALERFDSLLQDIINSPENEDIKNAIASPAFQRELAVLLGTSDFIWEDFLRMQHENLRPLFAAVESHKQLSIAEETIEHELRGYVEEAVEHETRVSRLNEFKDRQSFLIDMDHILVKDLDFFFLSRRLTALADAVVRMAVELAFEELTPLYGKPRTAAGVEAEWAVFGLGKLGGSALGYASDIELLFVYADNGATDGVAGRDSSEITNRDFFERLFKLASKLIQSRREGIFHVDLRLRPFGLDGPVAVKLESFAEYFGKGGQAHSAEKLALVRLRQVGGSKTLGTQVLAVRDRLIYETDNIDIPSLRELRRRQLSAKGADDPRGGKTRVNAKFSPGALVDLEYNVQILQVIHGRLHPELRVPGIHEALRRLSDLGTIEEDEAETVVAAYRFLRNLINGLRMLRGNAQDLFLPEPQDIEYQHLARRMGYTNTVELSAAEQLRIDFANQTALVRNFVEKHLGRDAIPTEASGSPADLILSESMDEDMSTRILESAGFRNPQRAMVNLRVLAGDGEQRRMFARLIVLAWDSIRSCPDADMALNNWEGFVSRLGEPIQHYEQLLSQHKRMQFLIQLMSTSQFLADTLKQNPDFFRWISDPRVVASPRTQPQMESDLRLEAKAARDRTDWLNRLRRFRKREILRIGLRDIGLGRRMEEIMGEISFLARAVIEVGLEEAWKRVSKQAVFASFGGDAGLAAGLPSAPGGADGQGDASSPAVFQNLCVLAFGKLGGWELNYSSDIDLLVIYRPFGESRTDGEERFYAALCKALVQDLTDFTSEGQAYRVDLRLRPYGDAGPMVNTVKQIADYYEKNAALWEHQALIKLKPVAGNLALGEEVLALCKPFFIAKWDGAAVRTSIRKLREIAVKQHTKNLGERFEVKNGEGGIRDIEFLVQGMQMVHCAAHEELLTGNTLKALNLLTRFGYFSPGDESELAEDYKLLRRVEHYLQLYEDRQLHALPEDPDELRKLATSVEPGIDPEAFFRRLKELRGRVRGRYEAFLGA